MDLVIVSDTHLRTFEVPSGNMLIHCGDALMGGDVKEMAKFAMWWNALPHKHKIFVPGNHDWIFQRQESLARSMLENTITLIDETVTIDGLKIHGTPRTPEFCGWAFMHYDDNQYKGLGEYFSLIPNNLDILISHGPPKGFLDDAPSGPSVGSLELLKAIERVEPKYVFVGHIHCGRIQGQNKDGTALHGKTNIVNCSNVNEAYKYVYPPRLITI